MNSIAEECNGTELDSGNHLDLGKNIIANSEAGAGRPSSPGDIHVVVPSITTIGAGGAGNQGVTPHDLSKVSTVEIQPCETQNTSRIVSVAPHENSAPTPEDISETLDSSFPARPLRSYRDIMNLSMADKQAAKRKLPVPRSSGTTSPALSQSYSTSSKL